MRTRLPIVLAVAVTPAVAWGHAVLQDPAPRTNPPIAGKTPPCEGPRTQLPTTYAPGQTITVHWLETIDHPGNYRIAFSPAADQGFDDNVLLDNIPDINGPVPAGGRPYQADVTLPTIECTDCTLQLIQVMTETVPPSLYYSCTDLVLAIGGGGDAGPPADAGPDTPDAAPTGGGDGGTANEIGDPPGLCSVQTARETSAWSALLLLATVFFMRLAWRKRR
jgi:hypothetical protein